MTVPRSRIWLAKLLTLVFVVPLLVVLVLPAETSAATGFAWPVSGRVLRGFEQATGHYGEGGHQGIDIAAAPGTPVRASADGTVAWVGELPRGRFVSVSHAGGVRTTYLDLGSIAVSAGQAVSRGQVIGTVGGGRDPSSAGSHLHFDVYLNGAPTDPLLVLNGGGTSFIRLCPVSGSGDPYAPSGTTPGPDDAGPGIGRRVLDVLLLPVTGGARLAREGASALWDGACDLLRPVASALDSFWDRTVYPLLCDIGRGFADTFHQVWSNRYVQAVVAGLVAAVALVCIVAIAFVLLPVSATVAIIAGAAAVVGCVVAAVVYAAANPDGFSFVSCFWKSFAAGGALATLVISAGSLSAVVSAGWGGVGIVGTAKAAFASGLFSAAFEAGSGYLLTGRISLKQVLVAFGIGFVSGGVLKIVNHGLTAGRTVQVIRTFFESSRLRVVEFCEAGLTYLGVSVQSVRGMVLVIEDLGLKLAEKVAYLAFSGSFGASIHISTCLINGRPITYTGIITAFITSAAMGAFTLFMGGFEGILGRFAVFEDGLGRFFKKFASRMLGKVVKKGLDKGVNAGLRRLFREEEALK